MAGTIIESELYEFLSVWRSRKQIQDKFGLTKNRTHRLVHWLKSSTFVDFIELPVQTQKGILHIYKAKPVEN